MKSFISSIFFLLLLFPNKSSCVEVLKDHEVIQILNTPFIDRDLPSELNLLVWNVYKGNRKNLYVDWAKLMSTHDLLLIQEAFLHKKFIDFYRFFSNFTWILAASFRDSSGVETGVVTASVQKPHEINFIRSPDTEPLLHTPKMILATTYPMQNRIMLLVLNIHGINFVSTAAFKRQMEAAFEMIASHRGPVIFGGDFNTWNSERMKILKNLASIHSLSYIEPSMGQSTKLDHVFQRGFEVVHSKVLQNISSSDHYPLSIKLRLGNY